MNISTENSNKTKRFAFIVHGAAGAGRARAVWKRLEPKLKAQYPNAYTMAVTEYPNHAKELAKSFIKEGYKMLVVIGGDGTINHVVNGYMQAQGKAHGVSIAILPGGTGGDFIRALGLNKLSLKEAWAVIEKGNIRDADVGEVFFKPRPELEHLITDEERARAQAVRNTANDGMLDNTLQGEPLAHLYFINICNIGMAADVVYYMEKHSKLKRVVRSLIYGLEGLRANIPFYRLNRSHLSWTVDSEEPKKETKNIYFVSICNGQYFGGGMRVTPKAKLHNGRLSLVGVSDMTFLRAVRHVLPGLLAGRIADKAGKYGFEVECTECTIEPAKQADGTLMPHSVAHIDIDGEFIGTTPLRARVIPGAVRLCIP